MIRYDDYISPEEYLELRKLVGWRLFPLEEAQAGLENSYIWCIRDKAKIRHRAGFGIGVNEAYWGLGIGRALTEACIDCAKAAGYRQLELDVLADNANALALYRSLGFVDYGRNPRGINLRTSGYHELVLMRLELD